jgi:KAP family P-loop domain
MATGRVAAGPDIRADPINDLRNALLHFPPARHLLAWGRKVGLDKFSEQINANARLIASWAGYFLLLLLLLERIAKISDPIRLEAKKRMIVPDYEKSLAFVEQFHRDFGNVVDAYFGDPFDLLGRKFRHRVFVFIDDLDRCEIPRAADLIQGLNLLVSDSPKIVFILGIDRQKIAAALAVKYKEFLPYFPVSHSSGSNGTSKKEDPASFDPTPGLEFGYSFLEKFIQLSFFVPTMRRKGLEGFLSSLEPKPFETPNLASIFKQETNKKDKSDNASQPVPTEVASDSSDVLKIASVVAAGFRFNPRRLKQFLNVFRLQRFIAHHTDQLRTPTKLNGATPEQLGKFVSILLRWPGLLPDLIMFPRFLADLGNGEQIVLPPAGSDQVASDPDRLRKERILYWRDRLGFLDLLFAGPVQEGQEDQEDREDQEQGTSQKILPKSWAEIPEEWSLKSFRTTSFLNVRPTVIPIVPIAKIRHRSRNDKGRVSESQASFDQSNTDFSILGESSRTRKSPSPEEYSERENPSKREYPERGYPETSEFPTPEYPSERPVRRPSPPR